MRERVGAVFLVALTTGAVIALYNWRPPPRTPLTVLQEPDRIILSSKSGWQTVSMRDGGRTGLYYDEAEGLTRSPNDSVLLLGLGGGEMVRAVRRTAPYAFVTAVELDSDTAHIAGWTFEVVPNRLIIRDACAWLEQENGLYAVVLVDLFTDSELVPCVKTPRFWEQVHRLTQSNGKVLVNAGTEENARAVKAAAPGFELAQRWRPNTWLLVGAPR